MKGSYKFVSATHGYSYDENKVDKDTTVIVTYVLPGVVDRRATPGAAIST